ncbi:hypothetical protein ANI_1_1378084 [Paecilomyces variotii No. 5]|uniref:Mitochondrial export protein Som1 n=1 Tax=Byssochlamys spectabilis (strain No. 5 / NBRC 109023) TaxID=1356009 RepID=V5FI69_BYSSN|nr:hypothetical protein ANI_1_1378084 [Paecilomyces variotii No. 5]
MAPLVPVFPTEALPERVNVVYKGWKEKRRKGPQVDLEKCELREMLQYSCNPPQEGVPSPGVVVCKPVLRLFRRCAGGLTIETTSWETLQNEQRKDGGASGGKTTGVKKA